MYWYWFFHISDEIDAGIFQQNSFETEFDEGPFKTWARSQINIINSNDKQPLRKLLRMCHGKLNIVNNNPLGYPHFLLLNEGTQLPRTVEDFVVYRGCSSDNHSSDFTSTSYDQDIAEGFKGENGFLWVITIKKGSNCIFMGDGGITDEKEVLLLPGEMQIDRTNGSLIYATFNTTY